MTSSYHLKAMLSTSAASVADSRRPSGEFCSSLQLLCSIFESLNCYAHAQNFSPPGHPAVSCRSEQSSAIPSSVRISLEEKAFLCYIVSRWKECRLRFAGKELT